MYSSQAYSLYAQTQHAGSQAYDLEGGRQPQHAGLLSQQPVQPFTQDAGALDADGRLRSVKELPAIFHNLFNFKYFNAVQSDCFDVVFNSNINMVVAAPTGSGKTGVMELALARLLAQQLSRPDASHFDKRGEAGKAVYLAPTRALVQEKTKDWQKRYGAIGAVVTELSGDTDPDKAALDAADIICTTPEKLDLSTRKLNEGGSASFFGEVSLVLIDEVHLLGEPGRGAALEAGVVSRIKMVSSWQSMKQLPISKVRFVAVSATIPNVHDIATWLGVPLPAGLHVYGEEMRPCKLRTLVRSYNPAKNDFLFERRLNDYVPGIIAELSQQKPTLVFCSSRKGTVECATHLSKQGPVSGRPGPYIRDQAHGARLRAAASRTTNKQLKGLLELGVGCHHAAMEASERELVEGLFLAQDLLVLCTTSTLALGVNLPAHLVIVKGTRRYCGTGETARGGDTSTGYKEYDRSVCLQMVGRAGRPGFDHEGVAVIMTQKQTAARYHNLMQGAEEVESVLKDEFAEHLNAEIVLQTIQDVSQAIQWLKSTFLYIRMLRKPTQYGVPPSIVAGITPGTTTGSVTALETYLMNSLVLQNVRILTKHSLVTTDEDGFSLTAADPGKIMAHHYIALNTMIKVISSPSGMGMPQLLSVVARAAELQHIHLRRGEKRVLLELQHRPLEQGGPRYPLPGVNGRKKDKISTPEEKIFLLINDGLSDSPCDQFDFGIKQEQEQVLRVAERVAAAMSRYFMHRCTFAAACNSLQLLRSLRYRMWPDTSQQCRQLPNVGYLTAARLAAAGLGALRSLAAADASRIDFAAQRSFPFGANLKRDVQRSLPPFTHFSLVKKRLLSDGCKMEVVLQLARLPDSDHPGGGGAAGSSSGSTPARLLVGSCGDDKLLTQQRLMVEDFSSPHQITVTVDYHTCFRSGNHNLVACVLMERSTGLDVVQSFDLSSAGLRGSVTGTAAVVVPPAPAAPTICPPTQQQPAGQAAPAAVRVKSRGQQLLNSFQALRKPVPDQAQGEVVVEDSQGLPSQPGQPRMQAGGPQLRPAAGSMRLWGSGMQSGLGQRGAADTGDGLLGGSGLGVAGRLVGGLGGHYGGAGGGGGVQARWGAAAGSPWAAFTTAASTAGDGGGGGGGGGGRGDGGGDSGDGGGSPGAHQVQGGTGVQQGSRLGFAGSRVTGGQPQRGITMLAGGEAEGDEGVAQGCSSTTGDMGIGGTGDAVNEQLETCGGGGGGGGGGRCQLAGSLSAVLEVGHALLSPGGAGGGGVATYDAEGGAARGWQHVSVVKQLTRPVPLQPAAPRAAPIERAQGSWAATSREQHSSAPLPRSTSAKATLQQRLLGGSKRGVQQLDDLAVLQVRKRVRGEGGQVHQTAGVQLASADCAEDDVCTTSDVCGPGWELPSDAAQHAGCVTVPSSDVLRAAPLLHHPAESAYHTPTQDGTAGRTAGARPPVAYQLQVPNVLPKAVLSSKTHTAHVVRPGKENVPVRVQTAPGGRASGLQPQQCSKPAAADVCCVGVRCTGGVSHSSHDPFMDMLCSQGIISASQQVTQPDAVPADKPGSVLQPSAVAAEVELTPTESVFQWFM